MKQLAVFLLLIPLPCFAETVCFTQAQLSDDQVLQTKLRGLQELCPSVFLDDGSQICFERDKVLPADRNDFDYFIDWYRNRGSTDQGEIILRNQDRPFRVKFLRGLAIIEAPQFAGLGILLLLPSSVSQWPEHPLQDARKNIIRAYTKPPVWDRDQWWVNAGHPLAGTIYYNMVRSQGATPMQSFLFSTFQSLAWEYVVEAVAEQPSIQDLLSTSPIGSLIGEGTHLLTLRMARNGFNTFEKIAVVVLNPAYAINNGLKVKRRPVPQPF